MVAVHHNIGVLDHLPGEEIGADPPLPPERAEVSEGVHPGWHEGGEVPGGGGAVERLVELTQRRGLRVGRGLLADPGGREAAARGVDGVPGRRGGRLRVDAEVLAGREPEREEGAGGGGGKVGEEEAELGEGLLHLVHGARAVDEAERAGRVGEGVGGDEGDQRRRLAGARGHLEQRVPARVEGALELPHVRVLLWVDRRVREVHRQAIQVEPHRGWEERARALAAEVGRSPSRRRSRREGRTRVGGGMPPRAAGRLRGDSGLWPF